MDVAGALADLTEVSSHVEAAVVFGDDGAVLASTLSDESRTERLARTGVALLEAAGQLPIAATRRLVQLEAALAHGSVFVARAEGRAIVATTGPAPAARLVFHDLETCLRAVAEARAQPPPRKPRGAPRKKKTIDA